VIPGVAVTVRNTETNVDTRTVTNATGLYEVPFLIQGTYEVLAVAEGFKQYRRTGVALGLGERVSIDVLMELGEASSSISVQAEAPMLNTTSASSAQVLNNRMVSDLPTMSNSVILQAGLAVGMQRLSFNNVNLSFTNASSNHRPSGAVGGNEWSIDGTPNSGPQLANEHINRGVTFGQMGHFRQSIASLTDAIRLAPTNPDGYFNRGTVYLQQGDFKKAIEDFSNVIRFSPEDETAYYRRGVSHEQAGRREQAIADYRQFLALSQDSGARKEIEQKLSQWNADKASGRSAVPEDRQRTGQTDSEKPVRHLDLYDLLAALGERVMNTTWLASGLNCHGESAEELISLAEQDQPIEGQDFLRITSGIQRTVEGDFTGFDPGAASHWIFLRAWNGSGFYIETSDPKIKERLKTQFRVVEEVEGAYPPYEGLFLPIESDK
jgi:tetratricopeptide (TPR) repeat protein